MLPISGGISFKSGNKTRNLPIQNIDSPEFVYLKLCESQSPCVDIGEEVFIGQPLTSPSDDIPHPVYSSISGKVESISENEIIIKNDSKNSVYPKVSPITIPLLEIKERDIEQKACEMAIYDNGILLSEKLKSALGKIENVIINCTDSEPPMGINHRILNERLDALLGGIKILIHATRARIGIIAIDTNSQNMADAIKKSISDSKLIITRTVENKYPIGNEKVLLFALTRREYQTENIIKDSKSLVLKAETAVNIYNCFTTGLPVVKKLLTISGGVKESRNLSVPIGTKISHVLYQCGGVIKDDPQIIVSGIMSGKETTSDKAISYETDSITVIKEENILPKDCIRCGKCIDVCPMLLKPLFLYSNIKNGKNERNEHLGIKHCILCGCCSFVCPAKLPLTQSIKESTSEAEDV